MKKTCALVASLLCLHFCFAQEPYFRHFSVEQGLPSSEVYDILQDRDGFIWISTDRGVSRYDGYTFRNFNTSDGLTDNTVFHLAEDASGNIWCAPLNSKLCYFSGEGIIPFAHNAAMEEYSHRNRIIQSLDISASGDVLVGYQQSGCVRINPAGKISNPGGSGDGTKHFYEVYISGSDLIYGSSYIEPAPAQRTLYLHMNGKTQEIEISPLDAVYYFTVLPKKNGTLLIGIRNVLIEIAPGGSWRKHFFEKQINELNEDSAGNSWISLAGLGVRRYASGAELSGNSYSTFLAGETVTDVVQDREGGYWMSTLGHGLFYLVSPHVHCLLPVSSTGGTPVTAIASMADGRVLLGTSGGLLHTCTGGKVTSTFDCNDGSGNTHFIQDIYVPADQSGVWIGTNHANLFVARNGSVDRAAGGFARTISGDGAGGTWIGGTSRLFHFDRHERKPGRNIFHDSRIDELYWDTAIAKLLVGRSDGLYWLNGNNLEPYEIAGEKITTRVSAIRRTTNNRLVIGTIGSGIHIIKDNRQVVIGTQQGLCSPIVNDIDVDENGDVWAATNAGIAQVHWTADTFTVRCFSIFHGLPTNEVRKVLCRNDTIWIGTNNGAAWFIPRELEHVSVPPPVYIQDILVNGKKTDFTRAGDFSHDQNQVRISFLGISYRNGGNTTYRYRLAGLEDDWTYTSNRSVEYASLPPGNYRFEVMARNGDGTWSASSASFPFIIGRPFWYTWWFSAALILLLAGAGWGIVRARLKSIRKDSMQKGLLAEYQHQALAAQMNPHFIFNSLSSMQAFVLGDEKENALRYIDRFSFLMRKGLEHSMLKFVPLEKEIELLRAYLDIEAMRFGDKLTYTITCEPPLDIANIDVPAMLIQPFAENAIRHGLLHREEPGGQLAISFTLGNGTVWCRVEDNGVGRARSTEINRTRRKHVSFGASITEERLRLLCNVTGQPFSVTYTDKIAEDGSAAGTIVRFILPSRKREHYAENAAH